MERSSDGNGALAGGHPIRYDGSFPPPEAPVVPVAPGDAEGVVTAVRTVLDAAATRTGRTIHWLPVTFGESAAAPIPAETLRVLRRYRVGLLGPPAGVGTELRQALDLSTAVSSHPPRTHRPTPDRAAGVSITLFRDLTEDAGAGLEESPGSPDANPLGSLFRDGDGVDSDGSIGYSASPISRAGTETLVDRTMDYAYEHDRTSVTIAHRGDRRPGPAGSFRDWALAHLRSEYADGIVDEAAFREAGGTPPDDELVILERRTDRVCRDLFTDPSEYDVVVAPGTGGAMLAAVAGVAAGHGEGRAALWLGPGRRVLVAGPEAATNPLSLLDAARLWFEYVGWVDAAAALGDAVGETLVDGVVPRDLAPRRPRSRPVDARRFAAAVVERLETARGAAGAGGVRTTAAERLTIKDAIATLHDTVFTDTLDPAEIELNQLRGEDEEADISLPEVGLNFAYWRRWSAERRLEVLLHELAHVEESSAEPDHGDAFYGRLVDLTEIALDRRDELAPAFGDAVDAGRVRRLLVESVHEETIEPEDDVRTRQEWLRDRLDLDAAGHY